MSVGGISLPLLARLKSCPDTSCFSRLVFQQTVKLEFFADRLMARLKLRPFKTGALIAGGIRAGGIRAGDIAAGDIRAGGIRATAAMLALGAAVLLAASLLSGAQQPSPSAHELAQRVDRHYNQLHSLKAGFTESYEGLGMQRTESGTLLLLKPGRMKWDYSNPAGKIFLLDGKYAWFYSQGDPQVQRIPAKQLDDLRSPLRFLLGHTELEKEMDTLTLTPAAQGRFTLSGQPKGQEKRVSRLSITATADGTITGIEIEETDGAITRFTFTGEVPNAAIPSDEFHFTAPPGLPVVNAASPV
jgi:outer membrane lipoprotein carrier protein